MKISLFTTSQNNQYHLQELELADSAQSKEKEKDSLAINILTGYDFHWEIVSSDIARANGGLVAINRVHNIYDF